MSVELKIKPGQNPLTSIVIVGESADPEELTKAATRQRVIAFARANGLPAASGLGNFPSPYPVDEKGVCDEDLILGRRPFAKFQTEYTVNGLG
jgi:hypothetical protein